MPSVFLALPTVFFVSSDGGIRQTCAQYLAAKGYDVVAAASATEARRSLHNLTVDAIILDTAAPDMSALSI